MAHTRRSFLGGLGAVPLAEAGSTPQRRAAALRIRNNAARIEDQAPFPNHPTNGDEQLYSNRIASFSKGLPHNNRGEVDPKAYNMMLAALSSGEWADFEAIPMGCAEGQRRRLSNPELGLAFTLLGPDSHALSTPPPPRLASAEQAAEAVELYWMALARDIPFTAYHENALTQAAATDLSKLSGFRGLNSTETLFRGVISGDAVGPYISQFLLKPIPFGPQTIDQRIQTAMAGMDYMTDFNSWLDIQNGCQPVGGTQYARGARYLLTGRDLARWVQEDMLYQAYSNACKIILRSTDPTMWNSSGAPPNPGNPYNRSRTQAGFGTFGAPHIACAVAAAADIALKAMWYQKWYVHRRLRPEEYGGLVHGRMASKTDYPLHSDVLNSPAVSGVFTNRGAYLLPQAYPEGSPLHPSYGAGHAIVAGACVTVLKAFFDETFVFPNPVMPSAGGFSLEPYVGPLTVGGELNKLASNIAMARSFAGIHWRTDNTSGLLLGEAVAIRMLREMKVTYNEDFQGFALTRFDGAKITV
jgi:hypothetical protein